MAYTNYEDEVKTKSKMRCKTCFCLNFNFLDKKYEYKGYDYCGLHGMARVDINGSQVNFDTKGGCGYFEKPDSKQLELF